MSDGNEVDRHYGRPGLGDAILEALRGAGKDVAALTPGDLAPLDHFHIGGYEATRELVRASGASASTTVLDVGGGIGGPARVLASELGCRVSVLDLTEEFCRVGADLTRRAGLASRVTFHHASALDMPFDPASFDLVWTQHSSMNIEDKERLYSEIHRVLRPGGRLALHEIMAGPNQPIHFPVPWAREPAISHLRPPASVRALLANLGFAEVAWVDTHERSLGWLRERLAAPATTGAPPLGTHLLLGADAPTMFRNVARNLEEGRLDVVQAVLER